MQTRPFELYTCDVSSRYERLYVSLGQMSLPSIAATTGCLAPCDYREYRPIGEPILWVGRRENQTVDETFIFQRNRQWQLFKFNRGLTEENYQWV